MLDKMEFVKPGDIEARSMEIITGELGDTGWKEPELSVVRRCIHTRHRYPDGHGGNQ